MTDPTSTILDRPAHDFAGTDAEPVERNTKELDRRRIAAVRSTLKCAQTLATIAAVDISLLKIDATHSVADTLARMAAMASQMEQAMDWLDDLGCR